MMPNWLLKLRHSKPDDILREFEISYPPVPINSICVALGIDVQVANVNWHSACKIKDNKVGIFVSNKNCLEKQRFSVAYQLGNLLSNPIECNKILYKEYNGFLHLKSKEETVARNFAMKLLMPEWAVRLTADKMIFNVTLEKFSKKFQVSDLVMSYRLEEIYYP